MNCEHCGYPAPTDPLQDRETTCPNCGELAYAPPDPSPGDDRDLFELCEGL